MTVTERGHTSIHTPQAKSDARLQGWLRVFSSIVMSFLCAGPQGKRVGGNLNTDLLFRHVLKLPSVELSTSHQEILRHSGRVGLCSGYSTLPAALRVLYKLSKCLRHGQSQ